MVDDRHDMDAGPDDESMSSEEGRRGGYAAAFDERVLPIEHVDVTAGAVSGIWNGLLSGVIMALVAMILFAAVGLDFWAPMKIIAVSILGPAALIGGAVPVIMGTIIHLIVSAILGMTFGAMVSALTGRMTRGTSVVAGVLYGLIIWITAQFIVLPVTFPLIAAAFIPWIYGLSHTVYGLVLGMLPAAYNS